LKFWTTFFPPKRIEKGIIREMKKHEPDIIGFVEVDLGSIRAKKNMAKFFSKELGMNYIAQKVKYPNKGLLRIFHLIPILRKQGNAIISKYPLKNIKYHQLSVGTKRIVIEATLDSPKKVTFVLAHLALGKKTRQIQIRDLVKIINKIGNPAILMGDFNTFSGEGEIKSIFDKTELIDKYELGKGNVNTHPSFRPSKRIDYILTSRRIKVKTHQVINIKLSDHLPILLDFA
jgi:endonuclease/exonuclease/phosphatase family metal-dependent hydrolase